MNNIFYDECIFFTTVDQPSLFTASHFKMVQPKLGYRFDRLMPKIKKKCRLLKINRRLYIVGHS